MKNSTLVFLIVFIFNGIVFPQFQVQNGKTFTNYLTVKLLNNVFGGNVTTELKYLSDIKSDNIALKNTLGKYGDIKFNKLSPNAIYGDTIKYDNNGKQSKIFDLSLFYRITFSEPVEMWKTIYDLRQTNLFEYVDPPTISVPCATPNDYSLAGNQWYLDKVNAKSAWDITKGNNNITIAIIDKGVKTDHPDLVNKIVSGGSTDYTGDHGTEVAGVAAASTDNGIGIASLGWNLKLISFNDNDMADGTAITNAYNSGAGIINCSYYMITVDPNDNTKYVNYDDSYQKQCIANVVTTVQ